MMTLAFTAVTGAEEELNNPGFEDPIDNDWICLGACTVDRTNEDAYQGQWSGKVTGR